MGDMHQFPENLFCKKNYFIYDSMHQNKWMEIIVNAIWIKSNYFGSEYDFSLLNMENSDFINTVLVLD